MTCLITKMRNGKGQFVETERIKKNCLICNTEFGVYPYQVGKVKFCSQKCWSISCGDNRVLKHCLVCEKEFRVYPSLLRIKFCSRKCKGETMKGIAYWTGKVRESMRGENNWAWKGGITPIKKRMRNWFTYRAWRRLVFERDNYTCQECSQYGGYLEAHHIIPIKQTFSRMFDITNGITLCRPCHTKTMGKEKLFEKRYFSIANAC